MSTGNQNARPGKPGTGCSGEHEDHSANGTGAQPWAPLIVAILWQLEKLLARIITTGTALVWRCVKLRARITDQIENSKGGSNE